MKYELQLPDFPRYERALRQFPKEATRVNILRETLVFGLKPFEAEARSLAPGKRYPRSIKRVVNRRFNKIAVVHTGPTKPDGSHGHLLELGTQARRRQDGRSTGIMPAQPHLAPAWDSKKAEVQRRVSTEMGVRVVRTARRHMRRAGLL